MVTYQFEIEDETWGAWKDTVPRSKSLDDRLRELIEADTAGRVEEAIQEEAPGKREKSFKSPRQQAESGAQSEGGADRMEHPAGADETGGSDPDDAGATGETATDDQARALVDAVAEREGWDDDGRLEARKQAAAAAVRALRDRGQLGKSEAVEKLGLFDDYPVAGQDAETWWRKNVRPVAQEIATYSRGMHAYVLDEDGDDSGGVYDPTEEF